MILNYIDKLIQESKNESEDYRNSKKVGLRFGAIAGGLGGGLFSGLFASSMNDRPIFKMDSETGRIGIHHISPEDSISEPMSALGGAALGAALGAGFGSLQGHHIGKELDKNPNEPYSASMVGSVKNNLKVITPIAALSGGVIGGLIGAQSPDSDDHPYAAPLIGSIVGAGAGALRTATLGSIQSLPYGLLHGHIVKSMRKKKS